MTVALNESGHVARVNDAQCTDNADFIFCCEGGSQHLVVPPAHRKLHTHYVFSTRPQPAARQPAAKLRHL